MCCRTLTEWQVATVRNQVSLSLFTDFENFILFKPAQFQEMHVNSMLGQLLHGVALYRL